MTTADFGEFDRGGIRVPVGPGPRPTIYIIFLEYRRTQGQFRRLRSGWDQGVKLEQGRGVQNFHCSGTRFATRVCPYSAVAQ